MKNTINTRNVIWVTLLVLIVNCCRAATQSLDVCLSAGNNCAACIQLPGCGYCGMYDAEGWCVPGNIDGSTIGDIGADEECPVSLWKFANSSQCYEPQRFIEVEEDTPFDKELVSRPIPGNSNLTNAADVITWSFGVGSGGPNNTGIGPNYTLAYSFQNGTATGFYSLQTLWMELFEYLDEDGGGFTCDYSNTSCPDANKIIRRYNLADADFTLQLNSTIVNQTTSFEKYQVTTLQGNLSGGVRVSFSCLVVNTNTTDGNEDYNPYEANCAFYVFNWPGSPDSNSRFGLHGYILSESPISVSSEAAHKRLKYGRRKAPVPSFIGRTDPWEYMVGDKFASFVWGQAQERNATVNGVGVSLTATELFDDDSFLPSYIGFKKSFVISLGGANPQDISWNPLYHITPFGFPGFVMDSSGSSGSVLEVYLPVLYLICVLLF